MDSKFLVKHSLQKQGHSNHIHSLPLCDNSSLTNRTKKLTEKLRSTDVRAISPSEVQSIH
jgi:hypothetical protein